MTCSCSTISTSSGTEATRHPESSIAAASRLYRCCGRYRGCATRGTSAVQDLPGAFDHQANGRVLELHCHEHPAAIDNRDLDASVDISHQAARQPAARNDQVIGSLALAEVTGQIHVLDRIVVVNHEAVVGCNHQRGEQGGIVAQKGNPPLI